MVDIIILLILRAKYIYIYICQILVLFCYTISHVYFLRLVTQMFIL